MSTENILQTYTERMVSIYQRTKELLLYLALIVLSCTSCSDSAENEAEVEQPNNRYYKGMDLSFMPELTSFGVSFKDNQGEVIGNNYDFLASKGVNLVRIRVWLNHIDGRYNLDNFKAQALQAQAAGMDLLLDFHYSDTWADPGAQNTPNIWASLDAAGLATATAAYTANALQELKTIGIVPAIVQIGNETNNGMLWPVGRIYDGDTENWDDYALINRAISNAIRTEAPTAQIMIHHAGITGASYFYEQLVRRDVDFDVIGLSYYPWWHGTNLIAFESGVASLSQERTQKIMVVETAYSFTLDRNDNLNNVVWNNSQLIDGYPATKTGQRRFLERLNLFMRSLPDNQGIGFCYWEPTWVAFPNSNQAFVPGTNWENVALFDFENNANTGLDAYEN